MGYYIRYIISDERSIRLDDIRAAFAQAGAGFAVDGEETDATVLFGGEPIGHVTLNVPGDGLFDDERDELLESVEDGGDGPPKERVSDTLRSANAIVAVQVLFGDGDTGRTLDRLLPLWNWLHANRRGLMQADGEGYYDGPELFLPLE